MHDDRYRENTPDTAYKAGGFKNLARKFKTFMNQQPALDRIREDEARRGPARKHAVRPGSDGSET